jgi:hypothetical protein
MESFQHSAISFQPDSGLADRRRLIADRSKTKNPGATGSGVGYLGRGPAAELVPNNDDHAGYRHGTDRRGKDNADGHVDGILKGG